MGTSYRYVLAPVQSYMRLYTLHVRFACCGNPHHSPPPCVRQ